MARPYSTDLRERVLAACERGGGSQAEIARRFRVGERTVSGWLKLAREGRRWPKPSGHGRPPLGGMAAALAGPVAEQNDATLAEYADRLVGRTGVRRSPAALCRTLKRLGLVRKKPSGRRSRTAPTSSSSGRLGAPTWPRSIPAGSSSSTRPGSTRA